MRIAVMGSGDAWHVQDLNRAAAELGHRLIPISFRDLQGAIAADLPPIAAEAQSSDRRRSNSPLELHQVDRVLVRTMPAGSLEQVIFRMDVLDRLAGLGLPVFNPPRGLEISIDKYLACCRMQAVGLPLPPTVVCERTQAAMHAFERLGGDVVVKPIFGSEGRGLVRVSSLDLAYRVFRVLEQIGAVLYLQQFIPHDGWDLRAFVLGDQAAAAMRRCTQVDWRTNVAQGSRGEPLELAPAEAELAVRAARAVQAPIAGVDLLPGRDGQLYVLEVNAVPGWRALARATGLDIARQVLQFVVESPEAGMADRETRRAASSFP